MRNAWSELTGYDSPELARELIAAKLLCPCKGPGQPRMPPGGICSRCDGDPALDYDPARDEDHLQLALNVFRSRILQVRLRAGTLPGPYWHAPLLRATCCMERPNHYRAQQSAPLALCRRTAAAMCPSSSCQRCWPEWAPASGIFGSGMATPCAKWQPGCHIWRTTPAMTRGATPRCSLTLLACSAADLSSRNHISQCKDESCVSTTRTNDTLPDDMMDRDEFLVGGAPTTRTWTQ